MKIDWHTHSRYSDGSATLAQLFIDAKAAGITHLGVVDHDTTAHHAEGRALAAEHGMQFIAGVEISAYDFERKRKVHMLGYGFTGECKAVTALCAPLLARRHEHSLWQAKQIEEAGLVQCMILCGATNNPFVYYKGADLVAVLSYYEGLCGVVNEAKMMQKPVIATEFSGINEQLCDGKNGYIVANDEAAILQKMREVLSNPERLKPLNINGMPEELLSNDKKIIQYEVLFEKLKKKES